MAAFVQAASSSWIVPGTQTISFPSDNGLGNCLLVDINLYGSGVVTVTDSQGNTYTRIAYAVTSATRFIESWAALHCKAGANIVTVTLTGGTNAALAFAIHEYANVVAASAVDGNDYEWVTSGVICSAYVTTTHAVNLLHGFAAGPAGDVFATSLVNNSQTPFAVTPRTAINTFYSISSYDVQVSSVDTYGLTITGRTGFLPLGCSLIALKSVTNPLTPGSAWLQIYEPIVGLVDRTSYIDRSEEGASKNSFTNTLRQRGTAQVSLRIDVPSTYMPESLMGCQVYLYDQSVANGAILVFAGTIAQIDTTWIDDAGNRIVELSIVSFEQCFDALLVPPQTFYEGTGQSIFQKLFSSVAGGVPVTLGNITGNTYIESIFECNWETLSELFNKLATDCSCIWGLDYATLTVYFKLPGTTAAPFAITSGQVSFGSFKWNQNRNDYRNRQIIRASPDAFQHSSEVFSFTGVPQTFTLLRALSAVTDAWYLSGFTAASQTGSLTAALPSDGDTVTISYPQSGSIYNWQPHAPYYVGQIIIDPLGNIQQCTAGTTPGSQPPDKLSSASPTASSLWYGAVFPGTQGWNPSLGGSTTDNALTWKNLGQSGAGGLGASVYTFRTVIDNRQWGEVLIDPTGSLTQTVQNLRDAINSNQTFGIWGVTFSYPTWENPVVNATSVGLVLTVTNKIPGSGYFSTLTTTGTGAFLWDGGSTTGGATGNSIQLQVSNSGNTANLYYTAGTQSCSMASRPSGVPSSGGKILISYQRLNGDTVLVEDTDAVNLRAAVENGTGKYQCLSSDTSNTSNTRAYAEALSALAAFETLPVSFSFEIYIGGINQGQLVTLSGLTLPNGISNLLNPAIYGSTWLVQEVTGELMAGIKISMDTNGAPAGYGHYKYTITVINTSQIFSYLDFWEGLSSGGGGSSVNIGPQAQPGSTVIGAPSGIYPMTASADHVTPQPGAFYTSQYTLAAMTTVDAPLPITPGVIFVVQLIQPASGSGYGVTWNAFYHGLSTFVIDQTVGTYASLTFQISLDGTYCQLLSSLNGVSLA